MIFVGGLVPLWEKIPIEDSSEIQRPPYMTTLIPSVAIHPTTSFINPRPFFGRMRKKESSSKFIKIRCPKCKNEQITFGKSSIEVKCLVCGKVLSQPTGGKSHVKAQILEVLE